jgi:predicted CXXCH cytochrome family protein
MTGYFIAVVILLILPLAGKRQFYSEPFKAECITCHSALAGNVVVHPELESTCDICHTPTGAEHPQANVRGYNLADELPELCYMCHTDIQENSGTMPVVHGPMNDKASCMNCHNPHSSPRDKLLINSANDLCLSCHNKTIVTDSLKIKNIRQVITNARSVHQAIEGGCVTCHNPHSSEKRTLLVADYPADQYVKASAETYELCFMCHDTDLLEAKTTEYGTGFRNAKTNLHYVHVNQEKGRSCSMCHDVHGSQNEKLIIDKLKFGNWEMKISFEATENGGSCLTACHTEKKYDRTIPIEVKAPVQKKTGK